MANDILKQLIDLANIGLGNIPQNMSGGQQASATTSGQTQSTATKQPKPKPEDQYAMLGLDPIIMKAVDQNVKKLVKEQTSQAAQAGMTPTQIREKGMEIARSGSALNSQTLQQAGIPQAQPQGIGQPMAQQQTFQPALLGRLLGLTDPSLKEQAGRIALQEQKLSGQEPLQAGEREKIEIQGMADLQKSMLTELLKSEKEGTLKPNEIFSQFEKASQSFVEMRDGWARIESAFPNQDFKNVNPASDLDLLFGTAKTLDPSGRVTDSDIAIQQAATGAYGDQIKKAAMRLQRKGYLLPEERKILYSAAQKRFQATEKQQAKTTEEFSRLAIRNRLDPKNVIRDVGFNQESQQSSGGVTSSGNKFRRVQ